MLPGLGGPAALALAERRGEALLARFAERRDNQAEAARLRDGAGRLADVDALLRDRRALTLVLEAFRLETEVDRTAVLRRVLTEDPDARGSLASRLADPRWRAFAEAFAARRASPMDAPAIAALPPEALRGWQLNRMAGLEFFQVQALTPAQVGALDPAQLAAIRPDALAGLELDTIGALSPAQAAALSGEQLRALAPVQLAAIPPAAFGALPPDRLAALSAAQLGALRPGQLAALRPEGLAAFSRDQARALSPAQREAVGAAGRAILDAAPVLLAPPAEAASARPPLADRVLLDRIVEGAMRNRYERAMGEANPGLREALYFRRLAGEVQSLPQLMSDRVLLEVTRGALGLPRQFAALSFEQQRDLLAKRLDLADLREPAKVLRMAQRYVAQLQAGPPTAGVAALFGGASDPASAIAGLSGRRVSFSA